MKSISTMAPPGEGRHTDTCARGPPARGEVGFVDGVRRRVTALEIDQEDPGRDHVLEPEPGGLEHDSEILHGAVRLVLDIVGDGGRVVPRGHAELAREEDPAIDFDEVAVGGDRKGGALDHAEDRRSHGAHTLPLRPAGGAQSWARARIMLSCESGRPVSAAQALKTACTRARSFLPPGLR